MTKLASKEDNKENQQLMFRSRGSFYLNSKSSFTLLKPVPRTKFSNDDIVQWDRIVHRYSIDIS